MTDIDQRIEAQINKKIDWFVRNMPPLPNAWATKTLRNLLNLLKEAEQ